MARLDKDRRDMMYRTYLTDCLQAIANNTTKHIGFNGLAETGTAINMRWIELINPKRKEKKKPVDNRPAEQIAADMWQRAKIGR